MKDSFILMADVVGSQSKDSKILMDEFKSVIEEVKKRGRKHVLSPLTITLGDEFQGVAKSLGDAIELVMDIEETIIGHKADFMLRYIILQGKIDTEVNKKVAYEMLGDGLTKARDHLENLKKGEKTRIKFYLNKPEDESLLNNLFYLFTSVKNRWKQSDYPLIMEFIKGNDDKTISENLSKESSLIWKRRRSLRIKQYFVIKESIRIIVKKIND